MAKSSIKKLEDDLWASADLLRAESNLNANEYCMPVLGLLFLKYAHSRFKRVEAELLKDRPTRGGRVMPLEPSDFQAKSAMYLPEYARYDFLVNLPEGAVNVPDIEGKQMTSLRDVMNNAMALIEQANPQLKGILPHNYNIFTDDVLNSLLRMFNNPTLDEVGGDVIGRIYEYFLGKFSKSIADSDGVFFTPKSLVQMIVNIIEPSHGTILDPACGSGGMFVQSGDFVNAQGMNANSSLTFYGQEKVDYNARLCLMNMAVHGLNANIKSGDQANSFAYDAHNLEGQCDFVMANPPFNVKKVKKATAEAAGRLPFGLPGYNEKSGEIGNANYLWIQYFYAYLNEHGRAGFVMASSATDSQNRDRDIREGLVRANAVDVTLSVANNFFYTLSLPCTLWFFDRNKAEATRDKVLFIDARNYFSVVDRNLNEWSNWQMRNLNAIVWLYRGETDKYLRLIGDYKFAINHAAQEAATFGEAALADILTQPISFAEKLTLVDAELEQIAERAKARLAEIEADPDLKKTEKNKRKKAQQAADDDFKQWATGDHANSDYGMRDTLADAAWLVERFGEDATYQDVAGLCRIATIDDIEQKNFSLTPGAYVGVADVADDDVDFATRMREIHSELATLNTEANNLMATIQNNFKELGL
jgi:type I restriction enzyme M protein